MINNVNDGYYVAMEVKTVSKYYNMGYNMQIHTK